MSKVLLVATVQSHICQFHKPLMSLLSENGWEIHVAARDNLKEKNGLKLEYADKVFDIPFQRSPFSPKNMEAYRQLKRVIEENQYDIIHCNTPVGGVLTRLAAKEARKNGTKVYYTAHGFHFYKGAPLKNWLMYYPIEKALSRRTDKLITITQEDYDFARKHFKCPVYHIHGVGANSGRYYPISREEQEKLKGQLGYSEKIILNVGELLPNKNQKMVILAMKRILEKQPDARLLIAGNGPEKDNLQELIKSEGLSENVEFLGYTTSLPKFVQICDVMAACSFREGLPLNIVEAMLCGKPVAASDNRGHRELISDGQNGHLVKAGGADELAECICGILRDPLIYSQHALETAKPYTDIAVRHELAEIYEL